MRINAVNVDGGQLANQHRVCGSFDAAILDGLSDHVVPLLVNPLLGLSENLIALGRFAEARPVLDRAIGLDAKAEGETTQGVRARFLLAKALRGLGKSSEASASAKEALARLPAGEGGDEQRREIETWVAEVGK